ncbi:hypothetical protein BKG91_09360 [Rodentibacter caecimuris]|uniref:Cyanophage baseplate Pam3 plug gp18 domain-containing protein n=2 Tax=Rodentibacter TaxID=1960084 RepID=A0A1V3IIB7_9PAST|nr:MULTISPECIES: hypothetical protein [Pasteurellaceae]AOF54428.1 hypothetical protein AC062_2342 [Pasteurellaceae bacterium NI1060]MCR1838543.1 hypothetical protein [Pasteurella caecimuris]MCU0107854.1 hypothetical protein [Pasteurella caecimuris]OOF40937.1 hypothetical protein BKK47_02595 [Rodentibacter mrazii]OOF72386.1 hypothetical protein BKG90_04660 [Rodentibacter heylii]
MKQIPLTSSPYQEQTIEFNGVKIRITLRFNSVGNFWAMDVYEPVNQRQICQGQALACGVPILSRSIQPYYFYLEDESGAQLDPESVSDLGTRCFLYIGEK